MKKTILLVVIFLISIAVFGQEFSFRGHKWGDSIESVIAKEGEPDMVTDYIENMRFPPDEHEMTLLYKNKNVLGYNATLRFIIKKKNYQLTATSYNFQYNIETSEKIWDEIINSLTLMYGERLPLTENSWLKTIGYDYAWLAPNTLITLHVSKYFNSWNITLRYFSPENHIYQLGPGIL